MIAERYPGTAVAFIFSNLMSHRTPRPSLRLAPFVAGTALLLACGSTTVDEGSGGGGGGAGGQGAGGDGGATSCADFGDQAPAQSVDVVVRNEGAENIYLSGASCAAVIDLLVDDPDGNPRVWRSDGCTFTCEELQQHGGECALDCAIPPLVMLTPGGEYHLTWTGVLFEPVAMPGSCYFDAGGVQDSCYQQQVATAGDYTVRTNAWASASGCTEVDCLCEPDLNGACELSFGMVEGSPVEGSATVSYPTAATVEIVFQ